MVLIGVAVGGDVPEDFDLVDGLVEKVFVVGDDFHAVVLSGHEVFDLDGLGEVATALAGDYVVFAG